jgi:nitric oxide reductase large subunit
MNRLLIIAILVLVLLLLFRASRPVVTRRDEQRRIQGMSLANDVNV